MKLSKEKEHMELNPYTLWLLELYFIFNSTNLNFGKKKAVNPKTNCFVYMDIIWLSFKTSLFFHL